MAAKFSGRRVALGLSGGLDSMVAGRLLLEAGHEVTGFVMDLGGAFSGLGVGVVGGGCVAEAGATRRGAEAAAGALGIPLFVLPLGDRFCREVLMKVRAGCLRGWTLNPCTICNRRIKFELMEAAEAAAGHRFDAFATGHYARVMEDTGTGRMVLLRGTDKAKDQSYFLSRLTQGQLARAYFPLGSWEKGAVRAKALGLGFREQAGRIESQDFLGGGGYGVLFREGELKPGDFVDSRGCVLGRHRGFGYYTIGQRRGLGLGGGGVGWRVVAFHAAENTIELGSCGALLSRGMTLGDLNWVGMGGVGGEFRCEVQIRRGHVAAWATVRGEGDRLLVLFDRPQEAITPGQVGVLYGGEAVLASGVILGSWGGEGVG